jgi:DNA polymerase
VRSRKGWQKLYGAKLVENVIQWLARIVLSQAWVRITRAGFRVLTTAHDELVVLLTDDHNTLNNYNWIASEMVRTPEWLPGIPLECEGGISDRYDK